jgi:hypothetical protein
MPPVEAGTAGVAGVAALVNAWACAALVRPDCPGVATTAPGSLGALTEELAAVAAPPKESRLARTCAVEALAPVGIARLTEASVLSTELGLSTARVTILETPGFGTRPATAMALVPESSGLCESPFNALASPLRIGESGITWPVSDACTGVRSDATLPAVGAVPTAGLAKALTSWFRLGLGSTIADCVVLDSVLIGRFLPTFVSHGISRLAVGLPSPLLPPC